MTDIKNLEEAFTAGEDNNEIAKEYGVNFDKLHEPEVENLFQRQVGPQAFVMTLLTSMKEIDSKDVYNFAMNLPVTAKRVAIELYYDAHKAYPDMKAGFDKFITDAKVVLDPSTMKDRAAKAMADAEIFFASLTTKIKENTEEVRLKLSKKFNDFVEILNVAYNGFVEKAKQNPTITMVAENISYAVEEVRKSKAYTQAVTMVSHVAGKIQETAETFKAPKADSAGKEKHR